MTLAERVGLLGKMHAQIARRYTDGALPRAFADAAFVRRFHETEAAVDALTDASTKPECVRAMSAHLKCWREMLEGARPDSANRPGVQMGLL